MILLLGGARSGKSATALRLAADAGLPVAFIATARPNIRQAGLGVAAGGPHRPFDLVLGSAIAAIVCLLVWRRAAGAALVVVSIAFVVRAIARWRIGEATGDVYGATAELTQLGALIVFAAHL